MTSNTHLRNGFSLDELGESSLPNKHRINNLNDKSKLPDTVTIKHIEDGIRKEFKYDLNILNDLSSRKDIKTMKVKDIPTNIHIAQTNLTLRQWLEHPYGLHKIRMELCDLNYPIYTLNDARIGFRVLDGYHRVAKALTQDIKTIKCIEFTSLEEIEPALTD
ncbi:hypothetical protein JW968_05450 [Candidatus Woesearchaeota archaeon]|nr:hypothetical protein [Candidatus Woesearchaeota archaeon]